MGPEANLHLGPTPRDRRTGRAFRVYNTHQYLTERARLEAVRIIFGQDRPGRPVGRRAESPPISTLRPQRATAGFRGGPGLFSNERFASVAPDSPTYHFYGLRLHRLDDILVNQSWRVLDQYVIDAKPDNTFPSDHFGVMADLVIKD